MKLNELKLEVDYFEFDEKYYHKVNPTPLKNAVISPFPIPINNILYFCVKIQIHFK